jgi:hypothetical protein
MVVPLRLASRLSCACCSGGTIVDTLRCRIRFNLPQLRNSLRCDDRSRYLNDHIDRARRDEAAAGERLQHVASFE